MTRSFLRLNYRPTNSAKFLEALPNSSKLFDVEQWYTGSKNIAFKNRKNTRDRTRDSETILYTLREFFSHDVVIFLEFSVYFRANNRSSMFDI